MYNQLKEIVDKIKTPPGNNKIQQRIKDIMDAFREHIFITAVDDKIYVIKRDQLDIFNKDEVNIELEGEEIKYLEPHMTHTRKHIGNPEVIMVIMKSINMSKKDRLRYEKYVFSHT